MSLLNRQRSYSNGTIPSLSIRSIPRGRCLLANVPQRGQAPIKSPSLGFLNLGGEEFSQLVDRDTAALTPIFSLVKTGTGYQIPHCDILFIYANVTPDGSVGLGADLTVRHLAERAGAAIAVVASSNPSANILAAAQLAGPKRANLVWTLDRKGKRFPDSLLSYSLV